MRPIGYYVHHHGDGHRQRAIAIAQAVGPGVTLLGTGLAGRSGGIAHVELTDDRLEDGFAGVDHVERPPSLHYAPIDHHGIRTRIARIAQWIAQDRPRLMVVDVSVEIAMLARLASVPTVYVRLNGRRQDRPHLDAFRGAKALLAPFHEALDDDATPDWVRAKTFYAPTIPRTAPTAPRREENMVVVVIGRGGGISDGDRWAEAARAVPERRWQVIGPCSIASRPAPNLEFCGWVDDADARIAVAGVVVGAAGDGVVSAVISHRRPFLCLPEPRPFDEQVSKAARLASLGAAVVSLEWPCAADWPGLLDKAVARASVWPAPLDSPGGPERVAHWLGTLTTADPLHRSRMA